MSNVQKLKRRAMDFEQKRQLDRALELYVQLLDEAGRELPDDDVPLYNRVGDLLVRKGDTAQALAYYERAVDAYAERGFLNNAIALCNKILRQSPGRASIYYKLGKISARKGFRSDARKNFLEYADRMQKAGNLDEAFRALKEFAALYPEQDDVRLTLADLLSREKRKGEALEQLAALYEKYEGEGRAVEARATIERMRAIDPEAPVPKVTGEQSAVSGPDTLVFLDLSGEEPQRPSAPTPRQQPQVAEPAIPGLRGLHLTFVPGSDEPAAPEAEGEDPASIAPAAEAAAGARTDGIEITEDIEPTEDIATAGEIEIVGDIELADNIEIAGDLESARDAEPIESHATGDGVEVGGDVDRPEHAEAKDDVEVAEEAEIAAVHHDVPEPVEALAVESDARVAFEPVSNDEHRELTPDEQRQRHMEQMPLTGAEFAGLPLTEIERSQETRAHDLVVPTALPQLGEDARNGEVITHDDAGHEGGDVGTLDTLPAIDEVLFGGDGAPAAEGGGTGDHERGVYRPTPASGERLTMPSPEELLQSPPSFGRIESTGGFGFPPLPGLTDDEEEGAASLPDNAFEFDAALAGNPTPIESLPPIDLESIVAPAFRAQDEAPVDAPLPEGLDEVGADEPPAASTARTPRATLSLGGAEGHLRQRIELDPSNWSLHRQLGEVLLDAGDRTGGLEALERAMAGFESQNALDDANEVADVVLRVHPNSIRHHQKRVEYAVRLKDRVRLAGAYLELADALFRTGEGDKSIAVYARVAELDPDNERALFALATLAPERVEALRGKPARRDRWSDELEAFPVELAAEPLPPPPAAEASRATPVPTESEDLEVLESIDRLWPESVAAEPAPATDEQGTAAERIEEPEVVAAPGDDRAAEQPDAPQWREATPASLEPVVDADRLAPESAPSVLPAPEALPEEREPSPNVDEPVDQLRETPHSLPSIEAFVADVEEEPAVAETAPPAPATDPFARLESEPPAPRAATTRREPEDGAGGGQYVDLGDWLRESESPRSTRMVVEDTRPTGDEQADFEDLLRRFKRGLAENVDEEDFEAHYDLGVAFKEMGLIDEAIAEFQKALRGSSHRIRAYEALGTCFVEKAQYPIAAALLQRAVELPGIDDQQLVGVLYLLGFASEQLGRHADALRYYQRVFAVDIDFRDVRQRVSAMEHLTK